MNLARKISTDPVYADLLPRVNFVLFDLEEWGLFGSASIKKHLKKTRQLSKDTIIINLDCVGNGDYPLLCHSGNKDFAKSLAVSFKKTFPKTSTYHSWLYPLSDDFNFKRNQSASVVFVNDAPLLAGKYIPNVHTSKDKVLKKDLIAGVTSCILDFLGTKLNIAA